MFAALLFAAALSTDAWLADFHQILDEMSSHYANLDSAIRDRGMNLPDLRRKTEETIRKAKSDEEARRAIESFLQAFGDGHVSIDWNPSQPSATDTPAPLCSRIGYNRRADNFSIDFTTLDGFAPFQDPDAEDFPGGILTLPSGRKAGVLRIQLFSPRVHPSLCAAVQKLLNLTDDKCDDDCVKNLESKVHDLLTAALERRATSIANAGASALVVDITGNGGGSDWVEPAARALTPVPLQAPRLGFIRHPHWVRIFREELASAERELTGDALAGAHARLSRAIAAAETNCDRSGVWLDSPATPPCSLVVPDMYYATGLLPYAKPGSVSSTVLFNPSQFAYHEGVNRLPLFVVVDGRTASAAELFASMLKDNGAATILGTPTLGSGCGHVNGVIPATLKSSGAHLQLPNCARFRADGTNEVTGLVPDVLIPFRGLDSRFQRAAKVARAIDAATKPVRLELSGGGEAQLLRNGDNLHVTVRAAKSGLASLCIGDEDRVEILHASAALGTAVYEREGEAWRLRKPFQWSARQAASAEEKEGHFQSAGWLAGASNAGSPVREFVIRINDHRKNIGLVFLHTQEPMTAAFAPLGMADDCRAVKLLQGNTADTARFAPETWMKVPE